MSAKIVAVLVVALTLLTIGNGTYMTLAPEAWYWAVPGVADRGPFNQHFVRDIGILYVLIGVGVALGWTWTRHRLALWSAAAAWLTGHAMFHVWEVLAGICSPQALIEDFAGVTLPALVAIGLALWARRQGNGA
jgi:uncharacterized protein YjeT (DUF2065 family)